MVSERIDRHVTEKGANAKQGGEEGNLGSLVYIGNRKVPNGTLQEDQADQGSKDVLNESCEVRHEGAAVCHRQQDGK
eukprot:6492493-Amphidinium_carterae.1